MERIVNQVPGHCDIFGNEKADKLARRGSGSAFCGPEPCLLLSTSFVRQETKEWAGQSQLTHVIGLKFPVAGNQNNGFPPLN
jgi:hypothetical protein